MKPANYAPVYAGLYPELAEIARRHGYAMAVHGSFAKDADLICIPWVEDAANPQVVVDAITTEFAIHRVSNEATEREHGRLVYTLTIAAPGCFIDLSFTPKVTQSRAGKYPRLRTVLGHKHTCANVQITSTIEDKCDCGALDTAGEAIEIPPSRIALTNDMVERGAEGLQKMYHGDDDEPFHLMARAVLTAALKET